MKAFLIVSVLIAVAGVSIWYYTRPEAITVKLHTVERGTVRSTVSNTRVGTVKACRRAYLAPATGGQVAELSVKEGSHVRKDQILMSVWNEDLRASIDLARADTLASRARAEEACAIAAGAKRDADRLIKLRRHKQIISEEIVDQAITVADSKRAACKASKASIEVNRERVKAAEAALERTLVKAPFDGVVAEVNAELGEFVTPSPPGIPTLPAIDLLDMSCLYVSAPIDEVDAPAIRTGMPACVSLDAFAEKRCSGRVRRIAPYVQDKEKQARTVEVEVQIEKPEELTSLLPGYSADIEVLLDSKENVLRIPTETVLEGNRVLIYREGEPLSERTFKPGISNWDYTEVQDGIEAGENVVVSVGKEGVKEGAEVVPENGDRPDQTR
ncbi:MAG: efflux RND transporter periplasmic adaptor subunit [Gammaproteobacteria bacterium]